MFETRPPRSDALDSDAGLALRTARSLGFAWRQLIGKLSVRHSTNLRLLCPGVDLKSPAQRLKIVGSWTVRPSGTVQAEQATID
jgi:hypothetical protein